MRVFVGSEFYFDYSTINNNCFIYYDLTDIKCLKAKEGYAIYEGVVLKPETCY